MNHISGSQSSSTLYLLITIPLNLLLFTFVVLLFILHSYYFIIDKLTSLIHGSSKYDREETHNNNKKLILLSDITSYISITLFILVLAIWAARSIVFIIQLHHCSIYYIPASIYITAKSLMYIIFVIRLDNVYNESIFAYNRKYLITFVVIIIISCFVEVVSNSMTMNVTEKAFTSELNKNMEFMCVVSYNELVLSIIAFLDLICSIGFMIAFIRPLKTLISSNSNNQDGDNLLVLAAIKTSVLTTCACSTTVIMLIFACLGIGGLFSGFDIITNVLSLMLFTKYYSAQRNKCLNFNRLCCCCVSCVRIINRTMVFLDSVNTNRIDNNNNLDNLESIQNITMSTHQRTHTNSEESIGNIDDLDVPNEINSEEIKMDDLDVPNV